MSPTKQTLHNLIDVIDFSEVDIVYKLLLKFIPGDFPMQDEVDSIKLAQEQIANGEYFSAREIDWDNLDSMDLD